MKKLLLAAVMLVSASAFAQTKIGLKAGINFAKMTSEAEGYSITSKSRLSYNFTAFIDAPINEVLSFQPGLSITGKGLKSELSMDGFDSEATAEGKADLMYLEVPLNAVAKFQAGQGKFFVGAGPYLAYGIAGKVESADIAFNEDFEFVVEKTEDDKVFKEGPDRLKPFDFGFNIITGYELNSGLSINAGYGLGLKNISRNPEESLKNKVFSISVGFAF